LIKSLPMIFSV